MKMNQVNATKHAIMSNLNFKILFTDITIMRILRPTPTSINNDPKWVKNTLENVGLLVESKTRLFEFYFFGKQRLE